jgi:CubicO group peptidase (beta-lactamase class C family)
MICSKRHHGALLAAVFVLSLTALAPVVVQAGDSYPNGQANVGGNSVSPALCQQIDQYIGNSFRSLNMVGYAFAIVDHGKLVFQRCYGQADRTTPVSPTTVFGIASITKTFTSLVLLSLVDQGKVSLDDSIARYLPDAPSSWSRITIRHLASMTAGFPRDLEVEVPWHNGGYDQAKTLPLLSSPGSHYSYSNVGYRILGQIIERITGKTLLESIRELILNPSGMNSTGILSELRTTGRLAEPFATPDQPTKYRNPGINFASGYLFSTLDDMSKYAKALMAGSFVSRDAYRIMWFERPPLTTGEPDYWAFGWGAKSMVVGSSVRKVSMNGGLPGVSSSIIIYPDAQIAIVSLSNFRTKEVPQIAQNVGRMIFPQDTIQQGGGSDIEGDGRISN